MWVAMTPEHALAEIGRMQRHVGPRGRWPAWVWLAGGLLTSAFGTFAPPVTGGLAGSVVAFGFAAFAVAVLAYALTQPVVGRTPARLETRLTSAFVGLVAADVVFRVTASPTHPAPAVMLFGCLPALPMLYGAWRVWRA